MLYEHAKLLRFFQLAGEITGRKKLQKMIYIAKKLGFDFEERFQFHFYGPYSEELTLKVEELHHLGFLEEREEDKGNYMQYRYRLTASGQAYLQHGPEERADLAAIVNRLNGENARFLELVSTVLFFEKLPRREVEQKIFSLKAKQNYGREEIDAAYAFIADLRQLKAWGEADASSRTAASCEAEASAGGTP
ncbi:YwgA family protein [Bacillaceae bacterium]